jgi:hypothetical protein
MHLCTFHGLSVHLPLMFTVFLPVLNYSQPVPDYSKHIEQISYSKFVSAGVLCQSAPAITCSHKKATLNLLTSKIIFADTVVSSAEQAVSRSPFSKVGPQHSVPSQNLTDISKAYGKSDVDGMQAEMSAKPWVWPTEGTFAAMITRHIVEGGFVYDPSLLSS